jgi:pullulanase-type alpha-1,6-glucosidase
LRLWALLATTVALATGCPDPGGNDTDAGVVADGGADAGTTADGGSDAGTGGTSDGGTTLPAQPPPVPANTARIHFFKRDGLYQDWGLHLWPPENLNLPRAVNWNTPWPQAGSYLPGCGAWVYYDVPLKPDTTGFNFILHQGDNKSVAEDMTWTFAATGGAKEIWQVFGESTMYTSRPDVTCTDVGSLGTARAHWVDRANIVWPMTNTRSELEQQRTRLYHSPTGEVALNATQDGLTGGAFIDLTFTATRWQPASRGGRFPHLVGGWIFSLPEAERANAPELLAGQLVLARFDAAGKLLFHTTLQTAGALDDVYSAAAKDARLGVTWSGGRPTFRVWAPTAKSVTLVLYPDTTSAESSRHAMTRDAASGVYSYTGAAADDRKYYRYEVSVYSRNTRRVETNLVTDPYSLSLSKDSLRSYVVNLSDASLKPAGWDALAKPSLPQAEDVSVYELHVRDFSMFDTTVPAEHRGKFKAFTHAASAGMTHLKGLADAGLSHLHLLPVFDIATIREDPADRVEPSYDNMVMAVATDRASEVPQQLVTAARDTDGFNWGYDPFHYTAPEGSYSTAPDDAAVRIVEFREMVQALNGIGLRVVMDVVYNHTAASGQDAKSVLDKVVPGYYHRLDENGRVANSTCCSNTATEHAMMRKLMGDSLVTWATQYKVDAFRFDLMGHHMKADMLDVQARLAALTVGADGVDGSKIYLYGEGWNFGEVENNKRGVNATQLNMGGTGIGTFNDRLRDAVRGGGPFDSGAGLVANQGFINGLFYTPNTGSPTGDAARARLLELSDLIRVGMAGNLASYSFMTHTGVRKQGFEVLYNGSAQTGYTDDPQETVTYVDKHDNQTLWDINAYKLPVSTSTADRVRVQNLGMSIAVLGQGIPFLHAGMDTLRSKSMDRDSYNSGDWFNRLDWSYTDNNWAVGAPIAEKNQENWGVIKPLLRDIPRPGTADIQRARDHLREVLAVRKSSRLFRLGTKLQVQERVRFHNVGPQQIPGLLVMSVVDGTGADDLDPALQTVVVLVNASNAAQTFTEAAAFSGPGVALALAPALLAGTDAVVKTSTFNAASGSFVVPARTTAVFVGTSALTLAR